MDYITILYTRNLKTLLHPIVDHPDDVARLLGEPASAEWESPVLESRLEARLQESYSAYMTIIKDMGETMEELKKNLRLENTGVQSRLAATAEAVVDHESGTATMTTTISFREEMDYQAYRIRFSFGEESRNRLLQRLTSNTEKLDKLLSSSDNMASLGQPTPVANNSTSKLATMLAKAQRSSELLFKALQDAWQCSCQNLHSASLRLEHRTIADISFGVMLMFAASMSACHTQGAWSWKELRCGPTFKCATGTRQLLHPPEPRHIQKRAPSDSLTPSTPTTRSGRRVAFETPAPVPNIVIGAPSPSNMRLCRTLGDHASQDCMGVIGAGTETFHLHPLSSTCRRTTKTGPYTLDDILSGQTSARISRRQRYSTALLVASSVAQLQHTSWLSDGLTKRDILFYTCDDDACNCSIPYHGPYIRRGFPKPILPDRQATGPHPTFNSLGILLIELCFGSRIEDRPSRRRAPPSGDNGDKDVYDTVAALSWAAEVEEEGGPEYAQAINWCFTGCKSAGGSWQGDMARGVVRPLETCQGYFGSQVAV